MAYIQKENYLNWKGRHIWHFFSEAVYQKPDKYTWFILPLLESKKHMDFLMR